MGPVPGAVWVDRRRRFPHANIMANPEQTFCHISGKYYIYRIGPIDGKCLYPQVLAAPDMSRRPVGTTIVKANMAYADRPSGVRTSIPGCCFLIMDVEKPDFIMWEKQGRYHRIIPCNYHKGAVRVQINKNSHRTTIPRDVADEMGVGPDTRLVWYAATDGKKHWEIQVEAVN